MQHHQPEEEHSFQPQHHDSKHPNPQHSNPHQVSLFALKNQLVEPPLMNSKFENCKLSASKRRSVSLPPRNSLSIWNIDLQILKGFMHHCENRDDEEIKKITALYISKGKADIDQLMDESLDLLVKEHLLPTLPHQKIFSSAKSMWNIASKSITKNPLIEGIMNQVGINSASPSLSSQNLEPTTTTTTTTLPSNERTTILQSMDLFQFRPTYPDLRLDGYLWYIEDHKNLSMFNDYDYKFTIRNVGNIEATYSFTDLVHSKESFSKLVQIHFLPLKGTLKCGDTVNVTATIRILQANVTIQHFITINIQGGHRIPVLVHAKSGNSYFGVSPESLPHTTILLDGQDYAIPNVLLTLEKCLLSNHGLEQEGIFRITGDVKKVQGMREEINNDVFDGKGDPICAAILIKAFFRELPVPIFTCICFERWKQCENEKDFKELLSLMSKENLGLLKWLVELLCKFSLSEKFTRMSSSNCAIVVSPNLIPTTQTNNNPTEVLAMMQKSKLFLTFLIEDRKKNLVLQ